VFGHEAEEVDDVDETDFEGWAAFAKNGYGGEGFGRGDVAGAGHDDIGFRAIVVAGEVPDADAFGAVVDGLIHVEVLEMQGLIGDDDVDVVGAAEAVVGDREEAVAIGGKIDACYLWTFVGDDIEEAGVLVGEAVVVLPPDERGDEEINGGDGGAPAELELTFLEPLGVLVEHGVDDVHEGLVAGEEAMTAGEDVAFEPASESISMTRPRVERKPPSASDGRNSASQVLGLAA